jgi:hypothetical protein
MRFLVVTLALLAVCVGWSLWEASSEAARLNQSAAWPTARASVVDSGVRDRGSQARSRFCPYVIYRYTVGGVLYDSTKVRSDRDLSQCSADRQSADDIVRRYAAGSTVPAHYDPARPGTSILEIHPTPWREVYPRTGLVATFIALVLVVRQAFRVRATRQHGSE